MRSSNVAAALFYSVVRSDFQERDWKQIQHENLTRDRFLFERTSLRLVAVWLAVTETLALPERLAVNSKFEMLMREFNPEIIKNCDPYIDA